MSGILSYAPSTALAAGKNMKHAEKRRESYQPKV